MHSFEGAAIIDDRIVLCHQKMMDDTWEDAYGITVMDNSGMFESGYVILDKQLDAEFNASTQEICKKIYISSCYLQEMSADGKIISSTLVTAPSYVAKDTSNFTTWGSFGSDATAGKSYRIKAVYYADGYTITRTSKTVTYQP